MALFIANIAKDTVSLGNTTLSEKMNKILAMLTDMQSKVFLNFMSMKLTNSNFFRWLQKNILKKYTNLKPIENSP